jgi:nucleolin
MLLIEQMNTISTSNESLESERNRVQHQLDSLVRIDRNEDMEQQRNIIELNERIISLQQAHDYALSSLKYEHEVVLSEKRSLEQTILNMRSMSNEGRGSSRSSITQKALLLFHSPAAAKKEPPTKKSKVETTVVATKKKESSDSGSDSSDGSSDSDDDETEVPAKKETSTTAKKNLKKEESSSSSSSSSSSDSDDFDDDEAPTKKKAKVESVTKKKVSNDDTEESNVPAGVPSSKRKAEAMSESNNDTEEGGGGEGTETKIYIRGLPWRCTEDEVRDFFASCGEMTTVELPLMDDGRSSGTAIIDFSTPSGAAASLEHNGADFGGRWLNIKYSSSKPIIAPRESSQKDEGCVTVFVGNLSFNIDEDTLRETFKDCGTISSIRFAEDKETGQFKGFGHVEFEETEATDAAVALAGTYVMDRPIRVDYANQKKSFGGDRGGGGGGRGRGGRGGYMGGRDGGGRGRGGGRGGGGRGGRDGGRGGGRGGSSPFNAKKSGSIAAFAGNKVTFD